MGGVEFPLGSGKLDALYLAVAAVLSSTVIIVKALYEKRELDTLAGRLTLGVLVIQDLFAILLHHLPSFAPWRLGARTADVQRDSSGASGGGLCYFH